MILSHLKDVCALGEAVEHAHTSSREERTKIKHYTTSVIIVSSVGNKRLKYDEVAGVLFT